MKLSSERDRFDNARFLFSALLLAVVLLSLNIAIRAQGPTDDTSMTRTKALRILKGCATRPITLRCDEDTAGYLITLYNRGDHSLLRPLLDAGLKSDGALSQTLGDFYSNVLWTHPRQFLESLRSRPLPQRRHLSWRAGTTDGGGMSADMLSDVRRSLRRLSTEGGRLSSVVRICLKEVNRANVVVKRSASQAR